MIKSKPFHGYRVTFTNGNLRKLSRCTRGYIKFLRLFAASGKKYHLEIALSFFESIKLIAGDSINIIELIDQYWDALGGTNELHSLL